MFFSNFQRRLQKELQSLVSSPPEGIKVSDETCNASDLASWKVDVAGPKETLFEGENFQLSFQFNGKYPFDSPIVTFTGDSIPMHPHVYRLFFDEIDTLCKEYKQEAQCAQKEGRMLVFDICGFIKNFLPNSYFILQIYHAKSFRMRHVTSLYFNFSVIYL